MRGSITMCHGVTEKAVPAESNHIIRNNPRSARLAPHYVSHSLLYRSSARMHGLKLILINLCAIEHLPHQTFQ